MGVEGRRLCGECVGTFFLTFAATGADIVDRTTMGSIGHTARYVAPALTAAFVLRKSFPSGRAPGYILAQLFGACAAAFVLRALSGDAIAFGVTKPALPFTQAQGFVAEVLLTSLLVFTILSTADQKAVVGKNTAPAVGGVIALCGLAFGPLSGASMNPARSLGPMIAAQRYHDLWISVAGPLIGPCIAVLLVRLLLGEANGDDREAAVGKEGEHGEHRKRDHRNAEKQSA
jgi:aquaporin Z